MRVEMFTFLVAAAICLGGALGVVVLKNPVHNALSLVATLFGVAVLFIAQEAYFLAAIQVIVYAGAIVILFLFVIMLLGVDRETDEGREPVVAQRPLAVAAGAAVLGLSLVALLSAGNRTTGARSDLAALSRDLPDIDQLGEVLFTRYVYAFEITAVLLTVAVVGAVVMSRRVTAAPVDLEEFPEGTVSDQRAARLAEESDDAPDDLVESDAVGPDEPPVAVADGTEAD